jgi:hypothetical protein
MTFQSFTPPLLWHCSTVLFSALLTFGARQTYLVYYAFQLQQKTMLVQHVLTCLVCVFRIFVCIGRWCECSFLFCTFVFSALCACKSH